MSRKTALNITFLIWFLSCIVSAPNFAFSVTMPSQEGNKTLCYIIWPDAGPFNSFYEY
ncbi:tachykinin-like peptides receptor 99D, partial [Dinothrombium tinctorium]